MNELDGGFALRRKKVGFTSDLGTEHPLAESFRAFVHDSSFPCVGAKAALAKGDLNIVVAADICADCDDHDIFMALRSFIERYRQRPDLFQSFVVVFEGPERLSERAFELHLWARLQGLSDLDSAAGNTWSDTVAHDPASPHFSMSISGEAFFVVGLHPGASRPARRFRASALVFNLHDQFERLRAQGRYEKLRQSIMARDEVLAGSANPMLARYGEVSEARQYSGRAVAEGWSAPFHASGDASADASADAQRVAGKLCPEGHR